MAKKKKVSKKITSKKTVRTKALVPAAKGGGRGLEQVKPEDVLLPRLKLLQALSPEVQEHGEKAGTIINNLTGRCYNSVVMVVPIRHYRSRIKWKDRDDGGGVDCSAPDGLRPRDQKFAKTCAECKEKDWNEKATKRADKAPRCTMYDNFVVLPQGEAEPVILPMERTKQGAARKWYSMAVMKGADFWAFCYTVQAFRDRNANDEPFFNYQVLDAGVNEDDESKARAENLYESLKDKTLQTEQERPDAGIDDSSSGEF